MVECLNLRVRQVRKAMESCPKNNPVDILFRQECPFAGLGYLAENMCQCPKEVTVCQLLKHVSAGDPA